MGAFASGSVKVPGGKHAVVVLSATLLVAGLALLQTLIGGRVLLFAFPGLFLIGVAAFVGSLRKMPTKPHPDLLCIGGTCICFAYILLRASFSGSYVARADLFSVGGALAVYALVSLVLTRGSVRVAIIVSLLSFGLIHVLIGAIQFTRGENFMPIPFLQRTDYGMRASGLYVCPNHLAGLLEVLAVFGLSLALWGRSPMWGKLILLYVTAGCYVGLLLTGSRGGYLSAGASLITFWGVSLIVTRVAYPKRAALVAGAGVIGLIAVTMAAVFLMRQSDYLSERGANIIDTKNMRVNLWRAAIRQWELAPIFGTGAGSYRFYGRQFRVESMQNDPVDVHNDYLHLLCEYGLVGAAGFMLFLGVHLRRGWRSLKILAERSAIHSSPSNRLALLIGALCAVAAYLVHSVFDFNLHIPANASLLALVFGVISNAGVSAPSAVERPTLDFAPRVLAGMGLILAIQAGRLFPGEYYTERARVALRDENPAAAIKAADDALKRESHNPEVFFYLGRAWMALAHRYKSYDERAPLYQKAINAFRQAHEIVPLDGTYPLDLGLTYDEMGRFDEAEGMYKLARVRDPNSAAVAQLYAAHVQLHRKSVLNGANQE